MSRFVSVAVPVPFLDLLTYRVPDDVAAPVRGARVVVPLGARVVTGIAVGTATATAHKPAAIKDIIDVLDTDAFLPPPVVDLALWVAEYYACGVGEALAAAMPPRASVQSERWVEMTDAGLRRRRSDTTLKTLGARVLNLLLPDQAIAVSTLGARLQRSKGTKRIPLHAVIRDLEHDGFVTTSQPLKGKAVAHKTIRIAALTVQGHEPDLQLAARQKEAVDTLRGSPAGLGLRELTVRGISTDVLQRLATKGLVTFRRARIERDPFAAGVLTAAVSSSAGRVLTDEQTRALGVLRVAAEAEKFSVSLLQGVTGSGKTEVYLRLAEIVQRRGRSVLVLVPEIALTPAVASAFREAFGDLVAVQHSGLSEGERYDQWHRIRRGEVAIVVGTRSAVFAPLTNLGAIIVDEEHDTSFKQEDTPRYHGRDVAVMRGKQEDALVVLGSATPSLESAQNATSGRYARIVMPRRVQDRPLARVTIVDMRQEYATAGPDVIFSERLKAAMSARLSAGQQSLVLLNRRGLATAVFCRQCGGTLECPNCSVSLVVHGGDQGSVIGDQKRNSDHRSVSDHRSPIADHRIHRARCHYCNFAMTVPKVCPACAGPYLERRGFGTERVAAEIRAGWPRARVGRLDGDTVRRRGAAADILRSMASGELDVLVGTQMIAKGHDFPSVTLVGVISADVGLGVADFRAAERTFQLLTQVAGRAGRGAEPGEAVVQTLYPEHYSILRACRQDYDAFFGDEMAYRRAMRYPPLTALVNLVVRAPDARAALADAATLAQHLRGSAKAGHFRVLGPAPAPVTKLRGEYRAQVFLKGSHRQAMRDAVKAALAGQGDLRRRVAIDIDPVSVL